MGDATSIAESRAGDDASDFFLRSLALPAPVAGNNVGGAGTAIKTILVPRSENRRNPLPHTVYMIDVCTLTNSWTVARRFSDFTALHQKLKKRYSKLPRDLPRKTANKLSDKVVEQRRVALEAYLKAIVEEDPKIALSEEFFTFLEIQLYDVVAVCNMLANALTPQGSSWYFKFPLNPTFVYCINARLEQVIPQYTKGFNLEEYPTERMYGLASLFRAVQSMPSVKLSSAYWRQLSVEPTGIYVDPQFRISVFESLTTLQIEDMDLSRIRDLASLQESIVELHCRNNLSTIHSLLVDVANMSDDRKTIMVTQQWNALRVLNLSHNRIAALDDSLLFAPQLQEINLSHNLIWNVSHMDFLTHLTRLDLSYNKISKMDDLNKVISQVRHLILRGNYIEQLKGIEKLLSLQTLDLAENKISVLNELNRLGELPLIERLDVAGNPLPRVYRAQVLAIFSDRAGEVVLDGALATPRDMRDVQELQRVMQAQKARTSQSAAPDQDGDGDDDDADDDADDDTGRGGRDGKRPDTGDGAGRAAVAGGADVAPADSEGLSPESATVPDGRAEVPASAVSRRRTQSKKRQRRRRIVVRRMVEIDGYFVRRLKPVLFQPGPLVVVPPMDDSAAAAADAGVQIPIIDIVDVRERFSADKMSYETFKQLYSAPERDLHESFMALLESRYPITPDARGFRLTPLDVTPSAAAQRQLLSPDDGDAPDSATAKPVARAPVRRTSPQKPRPVTMYEDSKPAEKVPAERAVTSLNALDLLKSGFSGARSERPKPGIAPPVQEQPKPAAELPALPRAAAAAAVSAGASPTAVAPAASTPTKPAQVALGHQREVPRKLAELRRSSSGASGAVPVVREPLSFEFFVRLTEGGAGPETADSILSIDLFYRSMMVLSAETGELVAQWGLLDGWALEPVAFSQDAKTGRHSVRVARKDASKSALVMVFEDEDEAADARELLEFVCKDMFAPRTPSEAAKRTLADAPGGRRTSGQIVPGAAVIVNDDAPPVPVDELMTFVCVNMGTRGQDIHLCEWVPVCLYPNAQPEWLALVAVLTDRIGVLIFPANTVQPQTQQTDASLVTFTCAELRAINVGIFAQYLRLEVDRERTLCLLTRDPAKTAKLVEAILARLRAVLPPSEAPRVNTMLHNVAGSVQVMDQLRPFIIPPRQPADLPDNGRTKDMPHFLEYMLVHQKTAADVIVPRTVVMTDAAVFLLTEDYAAWPPPSFSRYDFTKQMCYTQLGCFRIHDIANVEINDVWPPEITLGFEEFRPRATTLGVGVPAWSVVVAAPAPLVTQLWRLVCSRASQRDHFVRMLKQKWLELFGQELKVTLAARA